MHGELRSPIDLTAHARPTAALAKGTPRITMFGASRSLVTPLATLAHEPGRPRSAMTARMLWQLSDMGISDTAQLLQRLGNARRRGLALRWLAHQDDNLQSRGVAPMLNRWLSLADLLRTGLRLEAVRLLEACGIDDVTALASHDGADSRKRLFYELALLSQKTGYHLPTLNELNSAIEAARNLLAAIEWHTTP